ncbi:nucleoside triphosphate pyrophosphohydrolase [Wenzhouxiangella sediminis]|uniref:Nucleoside triphosphate pyrophosphohydrolase n=1 Tax=Wenzhouxiangella sediminis TaxID=1792836 RepID=A0A3E1KAE0_9GAMM|nr:nucleoside triphosphate pyrophosphohydrolase [Wenzhouxiangella sediminis]RFF31271.1 nucleoside triphosphate pyrophosphohydrolase [Wenzhouxiangella sediminis]
MSDSSSNDRAAVDRLIEIMARLRDPERGCPWDIEQTFRTIAPYTVEEAHEVADAIERDDLEDLRDELGDLLFQVVFHARMAEERSLFDFDDVAAAISDKLVRRHPHVFGDARFDNVEQQSANWEDIKAAERAEKGRADESLLDGVSRGLPALRRAVKLQKRAARAGFDWPGAEPIFEKLHEEADELRAALERKDTDNIEEEIGDLLFVITNLARKLDVDPGAALRRCNHKFERRFRTMEDMARERALDLADLDPDELEAVYEAAKARLKESG